MCDWRKVWVLRKSRSFTTLSLISFCIYTLGYFESWIDIIILQQNETGSCGYIFEDSCGVTTAFLLRTTTGFLLKWLPAHHFAKGCHVIMWWQGRKKILQILLSLLGNKESCQLQSCFYGSVQNTHTHTYTRRGKERLNVFSGLQTEKQVSLQIGRVTNYLGHCGQKWILVNFPTEQHYYSSFYSSCCHLSTLQRCHIHPRCWMWSQVDKI